ncbi:MAG: hypothetical protein QNJ54_08695 [Prochloraceae cyanobacterium]|nr:hypothetical protein [Prochloraceae cyanobacterium]
MGNYQARFWRAVERATSSLTLILDATGSIGYITLVGTVRSRKLATRKVL